MWNGLSAPRPPEPALAGPVAEPGARTGASFPLSPLINVLVLLSASAAADGAVTGTSDPRWRPSTPAVASGPASQGAANRPPPRQDLPARLTSDLCTTSVFEACPPASDKTTLLL